MLNVHAIVTVLGERDLLRATLRSIYDRVHVITVVSALDRDWKGRPVEPDGGIADLLERTDDPERKIRVIVQDETNQARAYNRVMDAEMVGAQRRVLRQHPQDAPPPTPDYFMLVDADEVWDSAALDSAFAHLSQHRPRYAQVPAQHYFGTWNYRVPGYEWFTVFVRADRRVHHMRNPDLTRLRTKLLWRVPGIGPAIPLRSAGVVRLAPAIAVFHHGSWVGPRSRIAAKVRASPHAHQIREAWLEHVWDRFGPDSTDLHPTDPSAFSRVERVPGSQLPEAVRETAWPPGYLDDA